MTEPIRIERIAAADAQIVVDEFRGKANGNGEALTFSEAAVLFETVRQAFLRGAECARIAMLEEATR
jgi:hypothetical protein